MSTNTAKVKPTKKRVVASTKQPKQVTVKEIKLTIASSTSTYDLAKSITHFFKENSFECMLLLTYVGAGAGHQTTKALIEANKLLIAEGYMIHRFDFWSTGTAKNQTTGEEEERSINNTRICAVPISGNSPLSILAYDQESINLSEFLTVVSTSTKKE